MTATCPHCGHDLDRRQLAALLLGLRCDDAPDGLLDRVRDLPRLTRRPPARRCIAALRVFVTVNEPSTRQTVRAGLNGTDGAIDAALEALEQAGEVHRDQSGGYGRPAPPTSPAACSSAARAPTRRAVATGTGFASGPWTATRATRASGGPAA
jgi:hypothetical protein